MNLILDTSDAELLSTQYNSSNNELHIFLNLWNDEKADIVFYETVAFCFLANSDPAGLRMGESNSVFLISTLSYLYENVPEEHNHVLYELLDNDDRPFVKIVAKNYELVKG